MPVDGGDPRSFHWLRSEKPRQQRERPGFDSRHLQECSRIGEHCWRCARPIVVKAGEDLSRPGHCVTGADSGRLRSRPELEILRAVVVAYAVPVVNRLPRVQMTTEHRLGNEDVLEDVPRPPGARVVRCTDQHISAMARPTPLPVAVGLPHFGSTRCTSHGLELHGPPTGAACSRAACRTAAGTAAPHVRLAQQRSSAANIASSGDLNADSMLPARLPALPTIHARIAASGERGLDHDDRPPAPRTRQPHVRPERPHVAGCDARAGRPQRTRPPRCPARGAG